MAGTARLFCCAEDDVEFPAVEAGVGSGVAGSAHLVYADQQGVAVAIHGQGLDPLHMSGRVALTPILLAGARVKRHPAGGHGPVQGLVIHPAEHEDLVGVELLDHRRNKPCAVAFKGCGQFGGQRACGHGRFGQGGGTGVLRHRLKSSAFATDLPDGDRGTPLPAATVPNIASLVLVSQVMHFVEPSREVLAETLLAAGPDAPTLCAGWRTRDLAAHLYLRERKAAVGLGLIIKSLAKASDQATAKLAAKLANPDEYAALVKTFRSGPPALSPMKIPAVDESANLIEYFVHTEDVRRAVDRWAPRALDAAYSDALWDDLVKRAAILYRGVDLGIVLVRPSGPRHVAKRAPVSVAIVGEPGELLMHAHGRVRNALVTFEGQPDAVALLQSAEVGL